MSDISSIINTAPLRTITNGDLDVFRYGLHKFDESKFEDPTYLGFTIEMDENSALFTQVLPFLEKHSATRTEMAARIPVYKEFVSKIVSIFNSQESVSNPEQKNVFIKQHYINSVSGLDGLSKKFNKWKDDKLSIELYEDIGLYSSYIAYLYNNLVYSYENGRVIIPENLLKFNLRIKISEIRNLTSIGALKSTEPSDQAIVNALKFNVTCILYKLFDCQFDFFNSKPFEDTITQAGIGATPPGESIVPLDIFYKSVSRHIYTPLVSNAVSMNDNLVDLGIVIVNSTGNANPNGQVNNSSVITGPNGEPYQELESGNVSNGTIEGFPAHNIKKPSAISTYNIETANNQDVKSENDLAKKYEQLQDLIKYDAELAPEILTSNSSQFPPLKSDPNNTLLDTLIGKDLTNVIEDPQAALNNLTNKIANKLENSANRALHNAQQILKQKRNALVRKFVNDVERQVGLKKIVPDNVYKDSDYYKNLLDQFKSDVGLTVGDEVIKAITGN